MPALADVLRSHAEPDARTDLIAGHRGCDDVTARELRVSLSNGDQRRQRYRADMQDAFAVHVVEFEALHLRAVDQSRVRRREPPIGAPDRGLARFVDPFERYPEDAAPFQMCTIDCAAQ